MSTKENTSLGSTRYNMINGKIAVTADEIKFTDMSITKMCPDAEYEIDFTSYLFHDGTVSYKIESGTLTFYKQDKTVMSFGRK